MLVIDLKSILYCDHSCNSNTKGVVNEYWQNYIFTNYGFLAHARISKMCQSLSRQLQSAKLFLLRSIPMHGIRPTNFSRKPSRHRSLFAFCPKQTLSRWVSRQSFTQYFSACKRKSRLAHLRRLRPNLNRQSPKAVRQRFFWFRSERNRLCFRFFHDRFMSFFVSLGSFSKKKRRNKTSHTFRSERSYPLIYQGYRWFCKRCKYLRRSYYRTRRFLHIRPCISRFRKIISVQRTIWFFYYSYKKEFSISENLFSSSRQITWPYLRSNNSINRILFKTTLSGKTSTYSIFRFRNTEISHVFNEQFQSSGNNHSATLQMSLASGTILQMD